MNRVAVVVLGDIGRSPRMQYHSMSLSKLENTKVTLIGYRESEPHPQIVNNDSIDIEPLKPFPLSMSNSFKKIPFISMLIWPVLAVCKVLFQIIQLMYVLLIKVPSPLNTILVQSPPAIPTIFVMQIVCWLRGVNLVIDWHNLGYTLLKLSLHKSDNHPIIRLAKFIERYFAKNAYAHLFVTNEMKIQLVRDWNLKGKTFVFHDKASPIFKRLTDREQEEFLKTFITKYSIKGEDKVYIESAISKKSIKIPKQQTSIIISSTSWTQDEDFSILLDAIVKYDIEHVVRKNKINNGGEDRGEQDEEVLAENLLFIITGKGPQKEYYQEKINSLLLKKSRIITVWLDSEDYPKLLACCDLGVSLHNSSSGIDLPMKVVDMFGCCLPVLAIDFKCIQELVKVDHNGFLFKDSDQLHQLLNQLFTHPLNQNTLNNGNINGNLVLEGMRKNLSKDRETDTWESNWLTIKPLFISSSSSSKSKKD
ncbi:hypothetical protein RB653_000475 [Dictyostelium firmibasis]|uniref:Beta-1,4-mannosyltransferase n=1 Tax=Dictyostelium firmibasis TaxID=79012 RepID=A0AAN7UFE0_9MYCE